MKEHEKENNGKFLTTKATATTGETCQVCNVYCGKQRHFQQHLLGKKHALRVAELENKNAKKSTSSWNMALLDSFPIQGTILDCSIMASSLSSNLQDLLFRDYCGFLEQSCPEWEIIFKEISVRYPKHLRLKELFETLETYRIISRSIVDLYKREEITTIYDFGCGHGLLGILLAYRFPKAKVVCVDLEKRLAFENVVQVVREFGVKLPFEEEILENLSFLESDFTKVTLSSKPYVICIHGCNEATQDAIEMAKSAHGHWAVMPCCIRQRLYMEYKISNVTDDIRHAISTGYISGKYGATKVNSIDRRITNRNLILMGN